MDQYCSAFYSRFHEACAADLPEVAIWGTGTPRREFLHVDDMADASLFVLDLPKEVYESTTMPMLSHINVGSGTDIAILDCEHEICARNKIGNMRKDTLSVMC